MKSGDKVHYISFEGAQPEQKEVSDDLGDDPDGDSDWRDG